MREKGCVGSYRRGDGGIIGGLLVGSLLGVWGDEGGFGGRLKAASLSTKINKSGLEDRMLMSDFWNRYLQVPSCICREDDESWSSTVCLGEVGVTFLLRYGFIPC